VETVDGDGAVNTNLYSFFSRICALSGWQCILVITDCNMLIALHPPPSQCGVLLPPYFCGIKCGVHDLRELLFYGIFHFVC